MTQEPKLITGKGQNVEYQLIVDSRPADLTNASATFKMRYADSGTIKVNSAATITTPAEGELFYGWVDPDLDTPGEYFAWFTIDPPSDDTFDTEEFLIVVTQHVPGVRTRLGSIARLTQSIIPITWNALFESNEYGDSLLQEKIEIVKKRALNQDIAVTDEATLDLRVQAFIAKLSVLEIIPAGVDLWMNKKNTFSASGNAETATYPDRIDALWKLYERLTAEVAAERDEIEIILGNTSSTGNAGVSDGAMTGERGFKTPHPSDFYDYSFPDCDTQVWPWSKRI